MKLKDSPKLRFWPESFGHWFTGADRIGGTSEEWLLVGIEEVRESHDQGFVLRVNVQRKNDLMQSIQPLFSQDPIFLKSLTPKAISYIGKSWKEFGEVEV